MAYSKLPFTHGVLYQKTVIFISRARKTSNHVFVFARLTVLLFCYVVKWSCDL